MKKLIVIFLTLTASATVMADPVSLNPRPRMMSMGNAGAALLGDKDSAMVNPAGLNDVEKSKFQILPLLIQVPFEVDTLNSYLDFQEKVDAAGATNDEKRAALEEFLQDVAASSVAMRVNLNPSYTRKNLHIGMSLDFLVNPRFRVGGVTSNQVVELGGANGTATVFVAYAHSFLNDRLKVGATLKPIYRVAVTANQEQSVYDFIKGRDPGVGIDDQILGTSKGGRRAFGVGFDLGARYDIPFFEDWRPSVGITYQDIGNTRFFGDNKPKDIDQSLSVGVAIHKQYGIFNSAFALDLRSINRNEEFFNKFHMGVETVIWNLLAIRAGLSQLYWTAGVGLDIRFFELDVFVTAHESGRAARLREERTLGTRISFAF